MSLHSRTTLLVAAALFGSLASAPLATAQDWRGTGRIQGTLTDPDGKPVADATVKANCTERGGSTTLKTDKKGRWVLGGVAACKWDFDFQAEGYETEMVSVTLRGESDRLPTVEIHLKRREAQAPDLKVVAEKAEAAYKAGHFDEARVEYEALLAARPDLASTIHQRIGFCYVQLKQYEPAIASLEKAIAADPANQQIRAIAAQAALEGHLIEKARQFLASLDESKITNPDIFFNMGINFFNAGAATDAISYFGKTLARDPGYVDAYYRRALAYLGQGKTAEAKADFQKVVELQPDGEMATMAKKALEQLK